MPVIVNSTPFAVLDGKQFELAVDEIRSKFPGDAPKAVRQDHEDVALTWQAAARANTPPMVRSAWTLTRPQDSELYLLQVGKKIFPMVTRKVNWGENEIRLYPPVALSDFDEEKVANQGMEGLYDEKLSKVGRIMLRRGDRPATDVEIGDGKNYRDSSYGWALWETAAGLLRAAQVNTARASDQIGGSSAANATGGGVRPSASLFEALTASTRARTELPSIAGPPLGHDLVDAVSWNGRIVAITTERDQSQAAHVWVQDWLGGKTVWREALWPSTAKDVPGRGVSVSLSGDTLHLIGGVDRRGESLTSHWEYDLGKAMREGLPSSRWSRGDDIRDGVAWSAVASADDRTHVVGGVAGYYHRMGGDNPDVPQRTLNHRRGMEVLGQRWMNRAAAPGEVTGASTASGDGFFVVGPGNKCDGKVYLYNATKGGSWWVLPNLPREVGLGQVQLAGDTLVYTGGFDSRGKAAKEIYTLDLNSMRGEWQKVGQSPYVAGKARVVQSKGQWFSLLVTPKGSRCFALS